MKFCGRLAARACASALLLMGFPSPAKAIGPGATSRFVPLTPARLMDTRDNLGNVPLGKPGRDATVTTQVTGRFGIPAGAVAAVLNVTVTEAAGPGFISVFPAGSARPLVSNVNTEYAGQTIPNLVTVPLGIGGQVSFYAQSGAHLIADVFGYYESAATATGGRLVMLTPSRMVDTRDRGATLAAGETRRVALTGIPPSLDAKSAVLNVTVTEAKGGGYWTVHAAGTARPNTSNLNVSEVGQTIANQVIVPIGGGGIDVFSQAGGHVIVDLLGVFTGAGAPPSADGLFVPIAPTRLLDTRETAALNPLGGRIRVLPGWVVETPIIGRSGLPSGVSAVAMNTTMVDASRAGFVTMYGAGTARPFTSTVNAEREGHVIANHAIAPVSVRGTAVYSSGGTHLVEDITGYYTGVPLASTLPFVKNTQPAASFPMRLQVPAIGVTTGVNEGFDDAALTNAAGHWIGTALPGQPGNMAIFGHRISHTHPFRDLDLLKAGDRVEVTTGGFTFVYRVTQTLITLPTDAESFGGWTPTPTITLIACHPPGSVEFRIVVRAELADVY